jgi:hypothetical protein
MAKLELNNGKWEVVKNGEVLGSFDSIKDAQNFKFEPQASRQGAVLQTGRHTSHEAPEPAGGVTKAAWPRGLITGQAIPKESDIPWQTQP